MRVPEEDPMHEAYWTYGDPGAPPHVKEYWLRPDYDLLPERWTDETETEERADWDPPYRWEPETRTWIHYDEIEQLERELALFQKKDRASLSLGEISEAESLAARIKELKEA